MPTGILSVQLDLASLTAGIGRLPGLDESQSRWLEDVLCMWTGLPPLVIAHRSQGE